MSNPSVRYEGLPELARGLKETDEALLGELRAGLGAVGDVVRDDARHRFAKYSEKTAAGFETRVRAGGVSTQILTVGQRYRKKTGKRPDWGAKQMTAGLLPARDAKLDQAERILDRRVGRLMTKHGF